MATRAQRRQATSNRVKAMTHPLRAEALRLIRDKGPISPTQIAQELGAKTDDVSYHVRKLKEFDCVEEASSRRVRATVETFYRATELQMVDTEEWGELAKEDPAMAEFLVDEFMQNIVDDYTDSRRAGIVGLDEEFWIVRRPLVLDPKGVREAQKASKRYENKMVEIAARSAKRRSTEGTEEVPTSSSIVFFKTPKPSKKQAS